MEKEESIAIAVNKTYTIKGEDLLKLYHRLGDVYSFLTWNRQYLLDALNSIHDENSIPQFVAKIGIMVGNMDNDIAKFNNWELNKLRSGMEIKELEESTSCN